MVCYTALTGNWLPTLREDYRFHFKGVSTQKKSGNRWMRYYFVNGVGGDRFSGTVKGSLRFLESEAATRTWGERKCEKEALE